jgi:uncharacterized RDD family membrane protein YckC
MMASSYMVAPTWKRVLAWVIDTALVFGLLLIGWVALVLLMSKRGQTPGKAVLRIRVVTEHGEPLPPGRFVVRELVLKQLVGVATFELSTIVGAAQLIWDRRPWWDRIIGCVVVDPRPNSDVAAR